MKKYLAREEFYPGLVSLVFKKNYLDRRELLKKVKKYKGLVVGDVLDIGCGRKPYRELFGKVDRYVGIDIENPGHNHLNEQIDLFFDGINIPLKDSSFDTIVLFQVIEHVRDLDLLILEIKRVLRPKGKVLISFPFIWPLHELPNDFRRFTPNGAKNLFESKGFKILRSEKIMGNYSIFFLFGQFFLNELGEKLPKVIRFLFFPIIFLLNILGLIFSKFKTKNLYVENFLVIAKK